jgi:hypothetical protein
VIATEAGNGQLKSGVADTAQYNRTDTEFADAAGRFLFEKVELLQVLMERLDLDSAFVEQRWLLQSICPTSSELRRRGDLKAFEAERVNRCRQAVSARTLPDLTARRDFESISTPLS